MIKNQQLEAVKNELMESKQENDEQKVQIGDLVEEIRSLNELLSNVQCQLASVGKLISRRTNGGEQKCSLKLPT